MTRTLNVPDGMPRVVAPTAPIKLAQRMIHLSQVIANSLPSGFYGSHGLDILLTVYLAEENAQYLNAYEINLPGNPSSAVTRRWIEALIQQGLIDQQESLLALSGKGHETVSNLIETLFHVQRTLD